MAWRKHAGKLPAPLREFVEAEWPPVPGECLGHYTCRSALETGDCRPRDGEYCGQACYEALARDHGTEALANAKAADAFTRFHQARLNWFGEGTEGWMDEFCDGDRHHEIRYAHIRNAQLTPGLPGLEKGSFASGEYSLRCRRHGHDRHRKNRRSERCN